MCNLLCRKATFQYSTESFSIRRLRSGYKQGFPYSWQSSLFNDGTNCKSNVIVTTYVFLSTSSKFISSYIVEGTVRSETMLVCNGNDGPEFKRGNFITERWDSAESLQAAEPPCSVSNCPGICKYWKPQQLEDKFTKPTFSKMIKNTFRICTHLGLL